MTEPCEIFFMPLGTSLRFRVVSNSQAWDFVTENEDMDPVDFRLKVLSTFVYDFKSSVVPQISDEIPDEGRKKVLDSIYRACVSLNPALDVGEWQTMIHYVDTDREEEEASTPKPKRKRQTKAQKVKESADKFLSLESHLQENVIGQKEAVDNVVSTLKREFAGLSDGNRPVGVFLFAGASGVGKSLLAEELHNYLTENKYDMVRIDCGEYQHKHENQKLGGCFPPGSQVSMYDGTTKSIEDIEFGNLVTTHTGNHKPVLETYEYDNEDDLIKLTTWGTEATITCTPGHEIYAVRSRDGIDPNSDDLEWIAARDLGNDDWMTMPVSLNDAGDMMRMLEKAGSEGDSLGVVFGDEYTFHQIKSVESVEHVGKVYDISVGDDTSYCVNRLAVHNSPPGYAGHEEGGQLTNSIINNPESVVLLDEVEKAHPDIMNTFLRVFDNGIMTDSSGKKANFNKAIIIMTTNLGNQKIAGEMLSKGYGFSGPLNKTASNRDLPARSSIITRTKQEISEHFTPELLNRIDKTIVFNHLEESDFSVIAEIELGKLKEKLEKQGFRLVWGENVIAEMVKIAANPIFGARGLARVRRQQIEDALASLLLEKSHPRGTTFQVVHESGEFSVYTQTKNKKVEKDGISG